jgi:methionine sulfoxide reductase heme-binding subunit
MRRLRVSALSLFVQVLSLLPLAWLIWDGLHRNLTANPVREIELRTGLTAFTLLVLSLACGPVAAISGRPRLAGLRRPLGLYAFFYACLHALSFVGLDYGFDLEFLREDLFQKPYALAGLLAFLALLPLAVTSTQGWKRRLGRNWKRLHRLAYVAALVAAIHFVWQTKADFRLPLVYGGVIAVLLLARLPVMRGALLRVGARLGREPGGDRENRWPADSTPGPRGGPA